MSSPPYQRAAPKTYDNPYSLLMPHEVAEKIRNERKPKSAVNGDVLPSIANQFSDLTAIPAARIFNFALTSNVWPSPWLLETQNAIPKCDNASDFDQLRNLSCTNALSKILESVVLDKLRKEVTISSNQYGGGAYLDRGLHIF